MIATIVGHILAIGIGLSLGLIGGGGSILAVPILMYVLGLSPKTA
ncbi:MAG: sulfite exporter TauE/SafE family protein, partial [Prochlorothrix sp.]